MNLRWRILGSSAAAAAVASAAVAIATERMLLDPHDRNVMLAVILGGFVMAVIVASALSRRLISDLEQMADTATRLADGDLRARTGVVRRDEVGTTASEFDAMACQLEEAARRREAAEEERRLLVASISHDLRTPIAAIQAALEAVEDGIGDRQRLLASAQRDVSALTGLVDDLFLLAQLDAGRYEAPATVVDLAEVVDDAVEALLPTAAVAGVKLAVRTTGSRLVKGSDRELGRVVRNLLDNAIRHAPQGSDVRVDIGGEAGRHVRVRITDEGPGFDEQIIDIATEAFVRGDDSRNRATGGAGLGLSIAAGVVKAHGGALVLRPGPGGAVEMELPLLA